MHTHEYDGDRMVRTVVERESPWDAEQREYMVALVDYEASLNEWGIPTSEATSIEADPANPKGKFRYHVDAPIDWVAQQVNEHLDGKGKDDPYRRARKIRVTRVER